LRRDWMRLNDISISPIEPSPTANTFIIAYHLVCTRDLPEADDSA
jgi:hypothetical protein